MTRHFVYQRVWATSNVFEAFFTRLKKDVFWLIFWMSVIGGLKSFFKVVFKCCKKTSFGFSSGDQLQMSWICFDWLRLITNSRQDSRLYNCPKSRTQSRIFNSWLIMSVNSIFAVKKKTIWRWNALPTQEIVRYTKYCLLSLKRTWNLVYPKQNRDNKEILTNLIGYCLIFQRELEKRLKNHVELKRRIYAGFMYF